MNTVIFSQLYLQPLLTTVQKQVFCPLHVEHSQKSVIDFFFSGYSERSKVFEKPTVIKNLMPFSTCEIPSKINKGICLDISNLAFETK